MRRLKERTGETWDSTAFARLVQICLSCRKYLPLGGEQGYDGYGELRALRP